MNCELKAGVNDCHWNIKCGCTSYEVTRGKRKFGFSRDWYSRQNCTLTQLGVHKCSAYLAEGLVS